MNGTLTLHPKPLYARPGFLESPISRNRRNRVVSQVYNIRGHGGSTHTSWASGRCNKTPAFLTIQILEWTTSGVSASLIRSVSSTSNTHLKVSQTLRLIRKTLLPLLNHSYFRSCLRHRCLPLLDIALTLTPDARPHHIL